MTRTILGFLRVKKKKKIVAFFVLGAKISAGTFMGTGRVKAHCSYLEGVLLAMEG